MSFKRFFFERIDRQLVDVVEDFFVNTLLPIYPRGIWHSEMFAFLSIARYLELNVVIESGIYKGESTAIINKYCQAFNLRHSFIHIAIDKDIGKIEYLPYVQFLEGDGISEVPTIAHELNDRNGYRTGILLDGPKGIRAVDVARECLKIPSVKVVAIHDTNKGTKARDEIDKEFVSWSTDDVFFVRLYESLDGGKYCGWLGKTGGKLPYLNMTKGKFAKIESYGPTLSFLFGVK